MRPEAQQMTRRQFLGIGLAAAFTAVPLSRLVAKRGANMPEVYMPLREPTMDAQAKASIPIDKLDNPAVKHALEVAGPNRVELEKALNYFIEKKDALELKAVCHLIAESAYRFNLVVNSDRNKPDTLVLDATDLKGDYLIEHVERRVEAWRSGKYAWTRDVPEEQFIRQGLSYRSETEKLGTIPLDRFFDDPKLFDQLKLGVTYEEYHAKLKELSDHYAASNNDGEKIKALEGVIRYFNHTVLWEKAHKSYAHGTLFVLNPEGIMCSPIGECTDLSQAPNFMLRNVGLPGALERVPLWIETPETHVWAGLQMPFVKFAFEGTNGGERYSPDWKFNDMYTIASEQSEENYFFDKGIGKGKGKWTNDPGVLLRENGGQLSRYNLLMRKVLDEQGPAAVANKFGISEYRYLLGLNGVPKTEDYCESVTLRFEGRYPTSGKGADGDGWHPYVLEPNSLYHLGPYNYGFRPILPAMSDAKGGVVFDQLEGNGLLYGLMTIENAGAGQLVMPPFTLDNNGVPRFVATSGEKKPATYLKDSGKRGEPLEANDWFDLMRFDGRQWVKEDRVHSDESSTVQMQLQDGCLYKMEHTYDRQEGNDVVWTRRQPGQKYSVYRIGGDIFHRQKMAEVAANEKGEVVVPGLDLHSGTFVLREDLMDVQRPFGLRDGALNIY